MVQRHNITSRRFRFLPTVNNIMGKHSGAIKHGALVLGEDNLVQSQVSYTPVTGAIKPYFSRSLHSWDYVPRPSGHNTEVSFIRQR